MFSIELVAGLLIGWVVGWIVDAKYWRPKIEAESREQQYENRTLQRRLDKTQDERDAAYQDKLEAELALGEAESKAKEAAGTGGELKRKVAAAVAESDQARTELEKVIKERDQRAADARVWEKELGVARKAAEDAQAIAAGLEAQLVEVTNARNALEAKGKASAKSAKDAQGARNELADAQARIVLLTAELEAVKAKADEVNRLRAELDSVHHKLDAASAAAPISAAPVEAAPGGQDDLERIRGIGKVFARRLNEAGIHTYSQLVASSPDELRDAAGVRTMRTVDPLDWVRQAEELIDAGESAP